MKTLLLKRLTDLEVLKNRLIYLATGSNKDAIHQKINDAWVEIYKNLGVSIPHSGIVLSDDMFLRAHWYMYHGNINRERGDMHRTQIFDEVFRIDNDKAPQDLEIEINNYVKSLQEACKLWGFLNIPEASVAWAVNKNLLTGDIFSYVVKLSHIAEANSYAFVKSLILSLFAREVRDAFCDLTKTEKRGQLSL